MFSMTAYILNNYFYFLSFALFKRCFRSDYINDKSSNLFGMKNTSLSLSMYKGKPSI